MKEFGFVRVAAATPVVTVADAMANAKSILALYSEANARGCAVVTFPELCLSAYTCGDLFGQSTLLNGVIEALGYLLCESAAFDTVAIVGMPLRRDGELYNCAVLMQRGRLLGIVPKQHIPNYGEFYELRNFTPGRVGGDITLLGQEVPFGAGLLFECSELPEFVLGVEICEDLWVPSSPSVALCGAGATVIANLSASDEVIGKGDYRRMLLRSQSAKLACTYIYADAGDGESTTDLVFAGHDLIAENGRLLCESALFETGLHYADTDVSLLAYERAHSNTYRQTGGMRRISFSLGKNDPKLEREVDKTPFIPHNEGERAARCRQIIDIQAHGLCKRVQHTRAKSLVIGISGGLDSCLALLVAVRAMDILGRSRKEVLAVTMPCFGTTGRTRGNAEILCAELGVSFRTVDIGESVKRHFEDIGQSFDNHDVTFENAQARERTQVLMDIANMAGGMVIGTGDLSELALGWATYNGDHMSMYGVNGSIPKTLVRHLVRFVAGEAQAEALRSVLLDILATPVSPELLPGKDGEIQQVTEDLVGPYALHDFFLYNMLRYGFSPAKLYFLAKRAFAGEYDDAVIYKWLRTFVWRFFSQQFKRSCLPDGPKVGTVALSPRGDWRMPSDASPALWMAELDRIKP